MITEDKMNVKRAYENFRALKDDIEKDGKIDMFEANVLLEFLEPYCIRNKNEFVKLKGLLLRAKENGGVSSENSVAVIEAIYDVLRHLRREYRIERTLGYLMASLGFAALFYYAFYC